MGVRISSSSSSQVALFAGTEEMAEAAEDLWDATTEYGAAALRQVAKEEEQSPIDDIETALDDALERFRSLAQRQLGVTLSSRPP